MTLADTVLADFDRYTRAAKTTAAKPAAKATTPTTTDKAAAAPTGAVPAPPDPAELDAAKEQILAEVRAQLDWDGKGAGDPNDSLAAMEDALADMLDAHVEIVWDGEAQLTLQVEGEEPVPLTIDYFGELLEALAKQGGVEGEGEPPEDEPAADGRLPGGQRASVTDVQGNYHAASGPDGGRFVSKGGTGPDSGTGTKGPSGSGTAPRIVKTDTGPDSGTGTKGPSGPVDLARRAGKRAGPRATSKAVGETLTAATGQRFRVAGDKNGTFAVGPLKKPMSGKKIALILVASWLAFGAGAGFLAAVTGVPLVGLVAGAAYLTTILAILKAR